MISLAEYALRLQQHDWYYSYADDHQAYRDGQEDRQYLQGIAREYQGDHMALWAFKIRQVGML